MYVGPLVGGGVSGVGHFVLSTVRGFMLQARACKNAMMARACKPSSKFQASATIFLKAKQGKVVDPTWRLMALSKYFCLSLTLLKIGVACTRVARGTIIFISQ